MPPIMVTTRIAFIRLRAAKGQSLDEMVVRIVGERVYRPSPVPGWNPLTDPLPIRLGVGAGSG